MCAPEGCPGWHAGSAIGDERCDKPPRASVADRFKLRADEDVTLGGAVVIPVGATAWGRVTSLDKSGPVGKRRSLAAKLLYVDMPGSGLPCRAGVRTVAIETPPALSS